MQPNISQISFQHALNYFFQLLKYLHSLFHTKSSKSGMCFTPPAHVDPDRPGFKWLVAATPDATELAGTEGHTGCWGAPKRAPSSA